MLSPVVVETSCANACMAEGSGGEAEGLVGTREAGVGILLCLLWNKVQAVVLEDLSGRGRKL